MHKFVCKIPPWNQYPSLPDLVPGGNQSLSTNVCAMKPIDPTLKNASVTLAGGACLLIALGKVFSPFSGLVPVRGSWFCTLLAIPLLCLLCGMLVRYRIGKPKAWFLALVGILAAVLFYLSRHTVNSPGLNGQSILYLFLIFLGILLPWDHIRENGDRTGVKSAVLCAITALTYSALFLVWERLSVGYVMRPESDDMRQLLLVVMTNVLPLACIPPLVLAVEFSFSKVGQWLGSRKWFFWLALPAAVISFLGSLTSLPNAFWFSFTWGTARWIRFFIQPVSIYMAVVIWRVLVKLFKGVKQDYLGWKDIFSI